MTRAALYARVSGDDRGKTGGANLTDQLSLCRKHAEEHGYEIVEELAEDDRGASGATFDLPQLSRALELARVGQIDVLIVRELDRLSRDLAKQLIVEQELKRAGVTIEYVLYDFPDSAEGRLNKNLRAMLAEYEREKIKQRMQRGMLRKIRNGETINHGHPPFGYENVEVDGRAQLAINEEEARTVRLIFELYTVGDGERGPMSIRAIAKYLSELQLPTYSDLRRKGDCTTKTVSKRGHWGISSVGSILKNDAYTGTWRYGRRNWDEEEQIEVDVPTIIDEATWETAQQRREKNKRRSKRNRKHDYLMAGRLVCGACGRNLIGNPSYGYHKGKRYGPVLYYKCQADARFYPCDQTESFRAEYIDAGAWEWVRSFLINPKRLEQSLRDFKEQKDALAQPLRDRMTLTDELIQEKQSRLDRLLGLYLDGTFEREELSEHKSRYERERDALLERRAQIEAQLHQQEFDEARLQSIVKYARRVALGVQEADQDFERRRQVIEELDVTGEARIVDGEKQVWLHCALGDQVLVVSNSVASIATAVASATRSTTSTTRSWSRSTPSSCCATSCRASASRGRSGWAR